MIGDPTLVMLDPVNVFFSSSSIGPTMEEFCVGISFLQVSNSRTLLLASSLQHGQTYAPSLDASPEIILFGEELSLLLHDVEA